MQLNVMDRATEMKEALMKTVKIVAIGCASGLGVFMAAPVWAAEYNAVTPPDVKWIDAPSIGPGAKSAVIDGDPKSTGPLVIRLKIPPKTKVRVHTHPVDENVTVLSGTLYFAAGDKFDAKAAKPFGPGSYFSIGKGKPMFAYTTDKEVVTQLNGNGPWGMTFLDPADGPEKKK
jgi:quercetin dioxygenase-like cupin family protein